jgi:hypothetical protein
MTVWILRQIFPSKFIGVFSAKEKAQEIATSILDSKGDLAEDFYWQEQGDLITGYNGERPYDTDTFRIIGIELDKAETEGYTFL